MKEIRYNNNTYTQVQKRTADKLFNNGTTIYMLPCKVSYVGMWVHFTDINISRYDDSDIERFKEKKYNPFIMAIKDYEWYNCNSELGTYASFYIIK